MKNYIVILLAAASMTAPAQVLKKTPNEISLHLGGGLTSVNYQFAPDVSSFNGYNLDFGAGYTYFFNEVLGIYIGGGMSLYNAQKHADIKMLTSGMTDKNGYQFDLHTRFACNEVHNITFFNIPVMLLFQQKPRIEELRRSLHKQRSVFYVMGGIKVAIPFKDDYVSDIPKINNLAYYPDMNNWAGTQRFAGLDTFDGRTSVGNLGIVTSWMLALEAGMKTRLNDNFSLYTGVYCDFVLNSVIGSARMPVRNFIAVDHLTDFTLMSFSDRMNIMAAGIRVRLAYYRVRPKVHCPYPMKPIKKYQ
jgi:hypothetical protein